MAYCELSLISTCSISLEFCLAGTLVASLSTMKISSLLEKVFFLKMILSYFSASCVDSGTEA